MHASPSTGQMESRLVWIKLGMTTRWRVGYDNLSLTWQLMPRSQDYSLYSCSNSLHIALVCSWVMLKLKVESSVKRLKPHRGSLLMSCSWASPQSCTVAVIFLNKNLVFVSPRLRHYKQTEHGFNYKTSWDQQIGASLAVEGFLHCTSAAHRVDYHNYTVRTWCA